MKLSITINKNDEKLLSDFSNNLNLTFEQLCNFTTYINKIKSYNDGNSLTIKNKKNVLHAINYNLDDNNNYWMILTNNYEFFDIMIPIHLDLNNNEIYNGLKQEVVEIIKIITS